MDNVTPIIMLAKFFFLPDKVVNNLLILSNANEYIYNIFDKPASHNHQVVCKKNELDLPSIKSSRSLLMLIGRNSLAIEIIRRVLRAVRANGVSVELRILQINSVKCTRAYIHQNDC